MNGIEMAEGDRKRGWSSLVKTVGKQVTVLQSWFQLGLIPRDRDIQQSSCGSCCSYSVCSSG